MAIPTRLFIATFLLVGGTLASGLLFPNFGWGQVATVLLLYSAVPFLLVTVDSLKRGRPVLSLRSGLGAVAASSLFVAITASQLMRWSDYFPRMSYDRLAAGNGFHVDSAFHISIVQGILRTGYPTTGQHLDPFIGYHSLTHYVDAGVVWLLGIDPWESYALVFFAKFISLFIALVFYAGQIFPGRESISFFFILSLTTGIVLSASGHVVGSHGQWFPVLFLLLLAHRVSTALRKSKLEGPDLALLSVVVVLLSLGKISLGFTFAVFAGFTMLLQNWRDFRVYFVGTVWALFFIFFGREFGSATAGGGLSLLNESWAEIWSAFLMIAVSATFGKILRESALVLFSRAFAALIILLFTLSFAVLTSPSDVFYFFFGALVVGSVFLPACLAPAIRRLWAESPRVNLVRDGSLRAVLFLFSLVIVFGPVIATAPFTPYRSGEAMAVSLVDSFSLASENTGALTNNSQLNFSSPGDSGEMVADQEPSSYFQALRLEVGQLADSLGGELKPLLWLSKEDFSWLGSVSGAEEDWSTSLLVTAVVGETLLFGVPESPSRLYGFADYSSQEKQLSPEDFDLTIACSFGRPVIQTLDIESLSFAVICN